ncbi:MAG TPA: M28 family peptidase [Polyangiaceae bacterium]|nr:M28 family peptidase [Polyangiaceae bacterium]
MQHRACHAGSSIARCGVSCSGMRELVRDLCSLQCAGRKPGTPQGLAARRVVVSALRAAGLDPHEQAVPGCGGANVVATIPGTVDRWIVLGAHYDHLGKLGDEVFWGADDNAAAVAILVEVARAAAARREGRGVVIAAFDGEEPPYFMTDGMGSRQLLRDPPVPRDRIDFMVAMDVVGHRIGPKSLPDEVGSSVFALGGERSEGTSSLIESIGRAEPGVIVRTADADIIPPLSDHEPFWSARIPFLLLTCGRSSVYHTPQDVPAALDYGKMAATARWLSKFVQATRLRDGEIAFRDDGRDDARTLRQVMQVLEALEAVTPEASLGMGMAKALLDECDREGRLPEVRHPEVGQLIAMIEQRLA